MSSPAPTDPAIEAVSIVMGTLADAFDPNGPWPPVQGSTDVHFFAGEGPATAAWDAHTTQPGCDAPFLWVRVAQRYRTKRIPAPVVDPANCQLPRAITVEVGVARCAVVDVDATWDDYAAEAATSLDDSWRIEAALCAARGRLLTDSYLAATHPVSPYGPEGGLLAWSGMIDIQIGD